MTSFDRQGLDLRAGDALVIVDLQRDFLPGGALAVAQGDRVLDAINEYVKRFVAQRRPVFATRDWHPPDHCSFIERGGPWPPHCIASSAGAAFGDGLELPADAVIVSKGTTADCDAYSGFDGTDLQARLLQANVSRLFVGGLATDYCVLRTVLDARSLGFAVTLLRDAVAAVDVHPGDGERAIGQMRAAGAVLADRSDVLAADPGP